MDGLADALDHSGSDGPGAAWADDALGAFEARHIARHDAGFSAEVPDLQCVELAVRQRAPLYDISFRMISSYNRRKKRPRDSRRRCIQRKQASASTAVYLVWLFQVV